MTARREGAVIIEINPEETFLTRTITDLHIRESASVAVSRLLEEIRGILPPS